MSTSKHNKQLEYGVELFNEGKFFDAHEVLEDVWRAAPEQQRKYFQGLIQVAVALHHHSRGNSIGCRSLLARAERNLSAYPKGFGSVDLEALLQSVAAWRAALDSGPLPPLPKLDMRVR
jgi:uncharacterized protein